VGVKQNNRFGYMKIRVPKTKWVLLEQFYSHFIFIFAMFSLPKRQLYLKKSIIQSDFSITSFIFLFLFDEA
jgi:hypothetical protein